MAMQMNTSNSSGWLGRRWLFKAGGLLTVAGLAAFAILTPSRSPYFTDPLTGPTSSKLSIPPDKYGYTPQGLRRNQSDNSVDRPVVKTVSGAYLNATRFTAEVSVKVTEDDIAFIGLGRATNDPDYNNEPANCFLFRIHNVGYNRIQVAVTNMGGPNCYLDEHEIGTYIPGTTENFRIVREGDYVTLSIPSQNVSRTYSISQYNAQLGLTSENTHLFFGNTGVGTVFSNFRIARAAAANDHPSPDHR
jgi:hypothetical protein